MTTMTAAVMMTPPQTAPLIMYTVMSGPAGVGGWVLGGVVVTAGSVAPLVEGGRIAGGSVGPVKKIA